jgi:hypothetical protein
MRASARVSPSHSSYWYGRIVYYFLGSIKRNLQHKRLFTAASRAVYAGVSLAIAGQHVLSGGFWQGLLQPHLPRVWIAIQESGTELFENTRWS